MAIISKIRRVANPRRGGKPRTRRFAARMKRRKANPKMVRNRLGRFVKRSKVRRTKRRATRAKSNPIRRRRKTSVAKRVYRRRKRNPMLVELGMVNPRRRRTSVAKRKYRRTRKANPRRRAVARVSRKRTYRRRRRVVANPAPRRRYRRRRAVASNPVRHYRRRSRSHNPRRRRHYAHHRNPFGSSTKDMVTMAGGVLVGVAAAKYLPSLIPASMLPTTASPYTGILITGASAFAAGYLAHRFASGMGPGFAAGVMAGGIALTLSQILNVFAPPAIASQLALSGVGDIVPGYFTVPQNSVTNRAPVYTMPAKGGAGVGAFTGAFGGRR